MVKSLPRNDLLLWGLLAGCLVWLFYPGLLLGRVPAFRDAYTFYYPQAVWLDHCAAQGVWFPAWNPSEGLGVSVAGQPTAGLYYPLRCLWWLPGLDVAQRFSVVLVAHVLLAAGGIRYAARGLALNSQAAWLAAISYALSCPVLFQHANPIYLISAAWLGFALGAWLRLQQKTSVASCLIFSMACAMMLLGGDPHTAVNAFILAGLAIFGGGAVRVVQTRLQADRRRAELRLLIGRGGWLLAATLVLLAVTAVQWIPALHWAAHSQRVPTASRQAIAVPGLPPESFPPAPPQRIYDFSLSPWDALTMLWPTVTGHYVPDQSRWIAAVPSQGRMWMPSMYLGIVPCLLGFWSVRRRRLSALTGLLVFSWLAALGNYSPVWLVRELFTVCGLPAVADLLPRDHVGSLYWSLTELLPGYSAFRYPAKWWVWGVAAISLLAATQFERVVASRGSVRPSGGRVVRSWLWISLSGCCASLSLWLMSTFGAAETVSQWLADSATDRLLGPPTVSAVARTLTIAFAVPAVVLGWLRFATPRPIWLLLVTLLEMTLVASQWVVFAPPPAVSSRARGLPDSADALLWADPAEATFRDSLESFFPGKLALLRNERCLHSTQSIDAAQLRQLKIWLSRQDDLSPQQPELDRRLAPLGVTHRLIRLPDAESPDASLAWQGIPAAAQLCQLRSNPSSPAGGGHIHWQWRNVCELVVQVDSPNAQQLVVRQFNDGGWRIVLKQSDQASAPLVEAGFLLSCRVPPGRSTVVFSRRCGW